MRIKDSFLLIMFDKKFVRCLFVFCLIAVGLASLCFERRNDVILFSERSSDETFRYKAHQPSHLKTSSPQNGCDVFPNSSKKTSLSSNKQDSDFLSLCCCSDVHMLQQTLIKCLQANRKGSVVVINGDLVGICKQYKKDMYLTGHPRRGKGHLVRDLTRLYREYNEIIPSWNFLSDPQRIIDILIHKKKETPAIIINLGNHEFYGKPYQGSLTVPSKETFIKKLISSGITVINSHLMDIPSYRHLYNLGVQPDFITRGTLFLGYVTVQLRKDRKHFGEIPKGFKKRNWIESAAQHIARRICNHVPNQAMNPSYITSQKHTHSTPQVKRIVLLCHADTLCHNGWSENEADILVTNILANIKKLDPKTFRAIQTAQIPFFTVIGHTHTRTDAASTANKRSFEIKGEIVPVLFIKPRSLTGIPILQCS